MTGKTFRMLLIDPEAQTITEHQVSSRHDVMCGLIGAPECADTFGVADFGDKKDCGFVDDGGLSRGEPISAFEFIGFPDPIAGKCLIYGAEKYGGETCDASFKMSTLIAVVKWLGVIVPTVDWVFENNIQRAVITWRQA